MHQRYVKKLATVGMTGFEPATLRFQSEYSSRTELHPEIKTPVHPLRANRGEVLEPSRDRSTLIPSLPHLFAARSRAPTE